MAYVSHTFAMDPTSVEGWGKTIANHALNDLDNSEPLVYAVIVNTDSMPTMSAYALTTFYQNLGAALSKLFNQRYEIGQALQWAASKTEKTDLQNASSFKWSSQQLGWVSFPPPSS